MSLILTNYTAADNLLRTGIDLGVLMEGLDGHWQNYLMPALAGGFRTTLPTTEFPVLVRMLVDALGNINLQEDPFELCGCHKLYRIQLLFTAPACRANGH